jgi:hypothetical protein
MNTRILIALCMFISSSAFAITKDRLQKTSKRSGKAWGMETQVDLTACDPYRIRSSDAIKQYAVELAALLNLDSKNTYRDPVVTHTEDDDENERGYSMIQLVGKALISAHFVNARNAIYLTVLHTKPYNPKEIAEFTKQYFSASDYSLQVTVRR